MQLSVYQLVIDTLISSSSSKQIHWT